MHTHGRLMGGTDAELDRLSTAARSAVYRRDWGGVAACSRAILERDGRSAEGRFLAGLAFKAAGDDDGALSEFRRALELDAGRHDAAVELASQLARRRQHGAAAALIERYLDRLHESPVYLHQAGAVLASIGLHGKAWPLFSRACQLQPGVDLFESNLAACSVFVGRIDLARDLYQKLIARFPEHQRYHYHLAKLVTATDDTHVRAMQKVIAHTAQPPDRNVFMYYAIGKELEDLGRWDEAFEHFRMAGDAAAGVADYDVRDDEELVDAIIETCDAGWVAAPAEAARESPEPIFVVGLPRSGTTLVERVLSSHSQVGSVGETQYLPMAVRAASGVDSDRKLTADMIRAAARADAGLIGADYLDRVGFLLGPECHFVDKLPFNSLYLGFIAKAFPTARFVLLSRHPMDACFAMYKQVFTGAYKFSYTQESLARFYIAYRRLVQHWRETLGGRIVDIDYEAFVSRPETEVRKLLAALGLGFEAACLDFDSNAQATATASAVQVRERMHTRSVGRWRRYERQLQPLRARLGNAGLLPE
jgi:tetratricopeptide (TPR) repeat protein